MSKLVYRAVTDFNDLRVLSELQSTAWSQDMFTSAVQMKAAVEHGGAVIAAYEEGRAAGFCYSFAAYDGNKTYLHSHMMVVHPDFRDHGVGTRLKLEQRLWAMEQGYSEMTWTYDPLQLRNGYLNLCKLGGTVSVYLPALYGLDEQGDPSDRFLIRWELMSPSVCSIIQSSPRREASWDNYMKLAYDAIHPEARLPMWESLSGGYLLAVPHHAAAIKKSDPEKIIAWKSWLREICERAFSQGFRVVGLLPSDTEVDYYVLEGER